ncbi:MAG: hypothetical protein AAFW46_18100 [Pseudomonadota bacterium]
MSSAALKEIERNLSCCLVAAAVAVGLLFPDLAHEFEPFVFTGLFFIVVFSLSNVDEHPANLIQKVDGLTRSIVIWQMLLLPAIFVALCLVFEVPKELTVVILATTTAGSVFASPLLVSMVGLDRGLALRVVIATTLLMPLSILFFGELSGVLRVDLKFEAYLTKIFHFLLLPLAIAVLFWELRARLSKRTRQVAGHMMSVGSTVAVIVFCVGVMAKLDSGAPDHMSRLLTFAILATVISATTYGLTALVFRTHGRTTALSAAMLTANRNVALSFALLSSMLPKEFMVYVAVSQFPIFVAPFVILLIKQSARLFSRAGAAD